MVNTIDAGEEELSFDRENERSSMCRSQKKRSGRKAVSTLYILIEEILTELLLANGTSVPFFSKCCWYL